MHVITKLLWGLALLGALGGARLAWACASCGSGGDDPLILAPDETFKIYVAVSRTGDYQYLDNTGNRGFSLGPVAKDVFTVATGKSLGEYAFLTLTLPLVRNLGDGVDRWGLGDPLVAARFTVLPQTFVKPWEPQVQFLAAYKPGLAPSVTDSIDDQRLDVFGSGDGEARAGLDVWWGMANIKFGAAFTAALAFPRPWHEDLLQTGCRFRSTVTVGYGRDGVGRVVGGVLREDQLENRINGRSVPRSGHQQHALFLTGDATLTDADTVRVGFSRAAAFWSDNSTQANAVILAYMRAW